MSETSTDLRPFYNRAQTALQAAHDACFNHPERLPLGMSHGPFSGVNEALGIVAALENTNIRLLGDLENLRSEISRAADSTTDAVTRKHLLDIVHQKGG